MRWIHLSKICVLIILNKCIDEFISTGQKSTIKTIWDVIVEHPIFKNEMYNLHESLVFRVKIKEKQIKQLCDIFKKNYCSWLLLIWNNRNIQKTFCLSFLLLACIHWETGKALDHVYYKLKTDFCFRHIINLCSILNQNIEIYEGLSKCSYNDAMKLILIMLRLQFHCNVIVFQCYSLYVDTHLASYTEVKFKLKWSCLHEYENLTKCWVRLIIFYKKGEFNLTMSARSA